MQIADPLEHCALGQSNSRVVFRFLRHTKSEQHGCHNTVLSVKTTGKLDMAVGGAGECRVDGPQQTVLS